MMTEYYWIAGLIILIAFIYKLSKSERPDVSNDIADKSSLENTSSSIASNEVSLEHTVSMASFDKEVLQYIQEGKMLAAIKQYRLVNQCGLKEAKESVEKIIESLK